MILRFLPVLACGLLHLAPVLAQGSGPGDEATANDLIYCAEVANAMAKAPDMVKPAEWADATRAYIATALSLTSADYVQERIPAARMKRELLLRDTKGQGELGARRMAEDLRACDTRLGAAQARAKTLGDDKSFTPSIGAQSLVPAGSGLTLRYDAPAMLVLQEYNFPNQYKYFASAGGFTLSVFIEPPKCEGGDTHEAVYKCYAKLTENVPFTRLNRKAVPEARWVKSSYEVERPAKDDKGADATVMLRHVNYLFTYRGKWVDVHASGRDPAAMAAFEKSFDYTAE